MANKIIRHRFEAPFVIVDEVPDDDDAYLLCLTSAELHVIRKLVFPAAYWRTRYVRPVGGKRYERASEAEYTDYHELLEHLEDTLEGDAMPCSDIKDGLQAIADALSALSMGDMTQNVNCGSGGATGRALACAVSELPNEDLLPPAGEVEPDEGEDPPEGFDTWEEYQDHKCRAAHFLWWAIDNEFSTFSTLSAVPTTAALASPAVIWWLGSIGVVFPPAAFLLLVTAIVAVGVISAVAWAELYQARAWWTLHKDDIVCSLYRSGSAADAVDVLADLYEDAIEAIVWSGGLAPLGPALAGALGLVGSATINTSLCNVLFQVVLDVTLPDAECHCGGYQWTFDTSAQGWQYGYNTSPATKVGSWTDAETGKDPGNGSAGRLLSTIDKVANEDDGYAWWYYYWPTNRPLAYAGMELICHAMIDDPGHSSISAAIIYEDDSYDEHLENNPTGWTTYTVPVAGGNVGKQIKQVKFTHWVGDQTSEVNFNFDHVSLV